MSYPVIEKLMALQIADYIPEAKLSVGTMDTLRTELRALLAERERLQVQVTEWEGHAQTYEAGMVAAQRELAHMTKQAKDAWSAAESYRVKAETTTTPSRRLRQYKGVVYRENAWETPDGKRYQLASGVVWNKSVTLSLTDLDIPALLALRDDCEEPVETLESIIVPALTAMYELGWDRCGGSSDMAAEDLAKEIRAWLATQPQTITPEQAVAVLVKKGAEVFYNDCRDTVFGQSRVEQGVYIVILPKGVTP